MITAAKESFAQRQRLCVSEERKQILHSSLFTIHLYEVCTALNLLEHGLSQS